MVKQWALFKTRFSVLLNIENLENNFVVSKVHNLVYLVELFKSYLNKLCLALMRFVLNTTHLTLMNLNLDESIRDLHFYLIVVVYYDLLWYFITSFFIT